MIAIVVAFFRMSYSVKDSLRIQSRGSVSVDPVNRVAFRFPSS